MQQYNDDLANDPKWKAVRYACFVQHSFTCAKCGRKGGELECHHIRPKAKFPQLKYVFSNLVPLCKACHDMVTGREEQFQDEFIRIVEQMKILSMAKNKSKKNKTAMKRAEVASQYRPVNPRLRI